MSGSTIAPEEKSAKNTQNPTQFIMSRPAKTVLLEVAIASVEDAVTAQAGGADRLELNTALLLGGLTPSLGMLLEVKAAVTLPVMVMIRPRSGGFTYSHVDFQVMRRDVDLALQHGADGLHTFS
jgi:copper homeostasis protein